MNIEKISWFFLHKPEFTGVMASFTGPEASTTSLKDMDVSRKEIYDA